MQAPKYILKTLESEELIIWVSKPALLEMPAKLILLFFWSFLLIASLLFLKELAIPFWAGESPTFEGEPVTSTQIWFYSALIISIGIFLGMMPILQRKTRYVVTDRRAFIYRPSLGRSYAYDFETKSWNRDYWDDGDDTGSSGPISIGGYFTADTIVETIDDGKGTSLLIRKLERNRNAVKDAAALKAKVPILSIFPIVNKVVDVSFKHVENPHSVKSKIESVLRAFSSKIIDEIR